MSEEVLLTFDRVTRRYGNLVALQPTSFSVRKGEFFSIIGPSGSGKTTLLGATAGFNPPSGGRILVNGRDIVSLAPHKRNIGMVFQNYALFPHMTVEENIAFPLRMRNIGKAETEERVRRMIGVVRLDGRGDRKPTQLSGGQQQRVALARAAVYNPELLLMDEPLGALDKSLRAEMQFEIKRFQEELDATVLYVTHDQEEAASMSHRIAVMNFGRVEQIGSAQELYENPNDSFVASFVGEANLVPVSGFGEPDGGALLHTEAGFSVRGEAGASPKPCVVCIRPEAIRIETGEPEATIRGTVIDAVHGTGSLRYLVRTGSGFVMIVRTPCSRGERLLRVGEEVPLSWRARDAVLVPIKIPSVGV